MTNANDCPEILLQEGARVPQSSGTRADQGGPRGQGGRPKQGGPDHDRGHDQGTGVPSQFETPPNECEFEHVNEVLNLVEIWADRPALDGPDQQWSLRCVHDVVVQPGTTQSVTVRWPVLSASEFDELSQHKMLLEICGYEWGVSEGKDASNPHLVGGIAPLRINQQAKACVKLLFRNPTEKRVTILEGDALGYAKLAGQGHINPEWYRAVESRNLVNTVNDHPLPAGAVSADRVQQLVAQLGIMENRLLAQHTEVRTKLINVISQYESVFTDSDVAVGKTDVLKMKIVLESNVTPVRAAVRKIKPQHQESLRKQIDSWLQDGVIAPAVSPWGSPLVPVAKKDGTTRWAVDYRELNRHTLPDAYPTPCLSQIVEGLAGSRVFSSLDAAQAFHNVPIEEDSQDATAFVCMYGLFNM